MAFEGMVRDLGWHARNMYSNAHWRIDKAGASRGLVKYKGASGAFCPWLKIESSKIPGAGKGLFTARSFSKGEALCLYTGTLLASCEHKDGTWHCTRGRGGVTSCDSLEEAVARCQQYINDLPSEKYQYVMKMPIYETIADASNPKQRRLSFDLEGEISCAGYRWIDGKLSKTGYCQYANCWHPVQHTDEQLNAEVWESSHGGLLVATRDIPSGEELLWGYNLVDTMRV